MDFKLKKSNLNFRVYTASSLPNTGNENDICVISDVPMKNWILSPDVPSGAPRTDGDVWIQYYVTGNTFNVLKNSTMLITGMSAKQYVNGAWVDKTATSYRGGKWTGWELVLYDAGDECTDVTGGWTSINDSGAGKSTFTKNSDHMSITSSFTSILDFSRYTYTNLLINPTGYSKLNILYDYSDTLSGSSSYTNFFLGMHNKNVGDYNFDARKVLAKGTGVIASCDVSSISTQKYVVMFCNMYGNSGTRVDIKIRKIWLSP